ncbi:chromate efflux transporter [Sporocytophaga sp.]|uniref:chromate efflux transporter n=1 Tax=Sporocytophaga sp. TaxID=2231183 RepID=UPI00345B6DD2
MLPEVPLHKTESALSIKKVRHLIFLKDVFLLSLSAFGGPQAHLALFFNILVKKRGYITEAELIELNSFCQILPGPASTQTLTAVGFKIGGPRLAFLTLLCWILPTVSIMTIAAIAISYLQHESIPLYFTRYIQPMAVGFVASAAYKISSGTVKTKTSIVLFIISAVICYFIQTPAIFPICLILGGFTTSFRFKKQPIEESASLKKIEWSNFFLFTGIFIGAALLGKMTNALPIRLFENFFRNGSLIFGGGQALSAMLYKEFVVFDQKQYLTHEEFLSGFALLQILPGPLFAFSSFVGALSMREFGLWGEILGGIVAAAGIFLPGTIMIFFIIRFWDRLKKYRAVRASLEGINAVSAGIVTATAIILFQPLQGNIVSYFIMGGTFCLLQFTKVPPPIIIICGLLSGFIF